MVTGAQVRMARAALRMGVRELATAADVSPNTVTRVEAEGSVNSSTLAAIRRALEEAGVQFIPENGGGPGVRLKGRDRPDEGLRPDQLTTENDG